MSITIGMNLKILGAFTAKQATAVYNMLLSTFLTKIRSFHLDTVKLVLIHHSIYYHFYKKRYNPSQCFFRTTRPILPQLGRIGV